MFGKAPQWVVVQGNVRRQWSERIILLGPDECQSGELLLDLGNLPGNSSNEDKLQMRKKRDKNTEIFWGKAATIALNALQQLSYLH